MSAQPASNTEIVSLYDQLLDCWNRRSAGDFAALFSEDGSVFRPYLENEGV